MQRTQVRNRNALLRKQAGKNGETAIYYTVLAGFALRLLFLIFLVSFCSGTDHFYLYSDDINYESLAKHYLQYADSLIDPAAFRAIGGAGYLQTFWPWVECLCAYLFRSAAAARFVNVILSSLNILILYRLVLRISSDEKTALRAGRLMAYLPVLVIFSGFAMKDTFITTAVFFTVESIVIWRKDLRLGIPRLIVNAVLLYALYFTRGAITELLLIFAAVFLLYYCFRNKKYLLTALIVLAEIGLLLLFWQSLLTSFEEKLEAYFFTDVARSDTATIALVRIDGLSDVWRYPFAYFFATLNPFSLNLFQPGTAKSIWPYITAVANVSIYPVAVANFLYIIKKKADLSTWIMTLVIYLGVITMSLGISRHYFFLFPVEIMNACLCMKDANETDKRVVWLGSALLLALVSVISFLRVMR